MALILWEDVPARADQIATKSAAIAWELRPTISSLLVHSDIGWYWHPEWEKLGFFMRLSPTKKELACVKAAAYAAVGREQVVDEPISLSQFGEWVKIASTPYVPSKRRVYLPFFPMQKVGGFPSLANPLSTTLAGGLIGAGLGYGAGYLGEKFLPDKWEPGSLRRTLAMLGGLGGASLGAPWIYSNLRRGRSLLDGSDLTNNDFIDLGDMDPSRFSKISQELSGIELGQSYQQASKGFVKKAFGSIGAYGDRPEVRPSALDVNVNQLGQVLWESGASPRVAATTMGIAYAAAQMPDPAARPNYVTPRQFGELGVMLGAAGGGIRGYTAGYLAGKALGLLTGLPESTQNTLKQTGAALGVVQAVVPRLLR